MPMDKNLDADYIDPLIEILGMRSQCIRLLPDGTVDFGCIQCHVKDLATFPRQTIIDTECAGVAAADWWDANKAAIIPFLEHCYAQREALEQKYATQLAANPQYLNEMAHGRTIDVLQNKETADSRSAVFKP